MNLFAKLSARQEAGNPVRIGLIGAGKFGSMFLAQALKIPLFILQLLLICHLIRCAQICR